MYSKLRGSWSVQETLPSRLKPFWRLIGERNVATLVSRAASNAYARVDVLSH